MRLRSVAQEVSGLRVAHRVIPASATLEGSERDDVIDRRRERMRHCFITGQRLMTELTDPVVALVDLDRRDGLDPGRALERTSASLAHAALTCGRADERVLERQRSRRYPRRRRCTAAAARPHDEDGAASGDDRDLTGGCCRTGRRRGMQHEFGAGARPCARVPVDLPVAVAADGRAVATGVPAVLVLRARRTAEVARHGDLVVAGVAAERGVVVLLAEPAREVRAIATFDVTSAGHEEHLTLDGGRRAR